MNRNRINKTVLDEQLPALLREKHRRDELPPNQMPSWEYVTSHTPYSAYGLNLKCQELKGVTLHEHLRDHGFGIGDSGYYATSHQDTLESIQYFIDSLSDRRGWSDNTIDAVKCALKKATIVLKELDIDSELLLLGQYESEEERTEKVQHMVKLFEELNSELDDGTMNNYTHYISEYYHTIGNFYANIHNTAQSALREFDFHRTTSDPDPATPDEIEALWTTLNNLTSCPYERYNKDEWILWLKILIVFLIAVGPRTCEITQFDIRYQIVFGDDPHVIFYERKNLPRSEGPVHVPIMFGAEFLETAVNYLNETNSEGALIPSSESASGCRVASTLNNWIARLCELSNISFEDGYLTIQNFRQAWKTRYFEAVIENKEYLEKIAEEDGKKDPKSDRDDYINQTSYRKAMREVGRDHFDDLFDITTLPDPIRQTLDDEDITHTQKKKITDF